MTKSRFRRIEIAVIAMWLSASAGTTVRAQQHGDVVVEDPAASTPRDAAPAQPRTSQEDLAARVMELERALAEVHERMGVVEEDQRFLEESTESTRRSAVQLSGYLDVGAFHVSGDGSGILPDTGSFVFPEYAGDIPDSWVFMGDPLSTAINARGEPADTGPSRAVAFDPVDAGGAFSFLVNTASLNVFAPLGTEDLTANVRVDFMPRLRNVARIGDRALGDFVDVRLAYLEYRRASDAFDVSLAAGKIDSVLGVEYRTQDAPDRMEVTPSLLCRYTCGRPVGARARMRFLETRALVANVAVTNGSHFTELFPFNADVDLNDGVTGAGRLSYEVPIGSGIEVGVSGALGAQDMQASNRLVQWHVGADLLADLQNVYFAAELVQGRAPGDEEAAGPACGLAPCLRYRAAYGRFGYRVTNWLMPYVRVDWRDAVHRDGASFIYLAELVRFTGGLRFEPSAAVVVKVEYTANIELGRIPQFPNDVLTSSLVARF